MGRRGAVGEYPRGLSQTNCGHECEERGRYVAKIGAAFFGAVYDLTEHRRFYIERRRRVDRCASIPSEAHNAETTTDPAMSIGQCSPV